MNRAYLVGRIVKVEPDGDTLIVHVSVPEDTHLLKAHGLDADYLKRHAPVGALLSAECSVHPEVESGASLFIERVIAIVPPKETP